MIGAPNVRGMPIAIGFAESRRSVPPKGATSYAAVSIHEHDGRHASFGSHRRIVADTAQVGRAGARKWWRHRNARPSLSPIP